MFLLPTVLKTTVQQRGQLHNQGTKPNKFTCVAIQRESAFGAGLFIKFPGVGWGGGDSFCPLPTSTGPLRLAGISTAISSSSLKLAAWPLLGLPAVFPAAC